MAAAIAVSRGVASVFRHSSTPVLRPLDAVVLQVVLFAGIEVVERVLAGHTWLGLVRERIFLLGIVLQIAVGVVLAVLLWLLERAGRHVAERWKPHGLPRMPSVAFAIQLADGFRTLSILIDRPSRAPPASV
jgi:hypothetical protein